MGDIKRYRIEDPHLECAVAMQIGEAVCGKIVGGTLEEDVHFGDLVKWEDVEPMLKRISTLLAVLEPEKRDSVAYMLRAWGARTQEAYGRSAAAEIFERATALEAALKEVRNV